MLFGTVGGAKEFEVCGVCPEGRRGVILVSSKEYRDFWGALVCYVFGEEDLPRTWTIDVVEVSPFLMSLAL